MNRKMLSVLKKSLLLECALLFPRILILWFFERESLLFPCSSAQFTVRPEHVRSGYIVDIDDLMESMLNSRRAS
jgi:hypothetical protein